MYIASSIIKEITTLFCFLSSAHHCFDKIPELAMKVNKKLDELTSGFYPANSTVGLHYRTKRAFTDIYGEKPLTLYLVMDQSGSIQDEDFDNAVRFMKALIDKVFQSCC